MGTLQNNIQIRKQLNQRMQSSSKYSQSHSQVSNSEPKFVSIDEHWVSSHQIALKQTLLTCPICYTIPLDYPVECYKCERIFCKKDYEKVILSENQAENRCPTCKLSPWLKKQHIHITYKHMFDSLRLRCKICQEQNQYSLINLDKEMTKEQLIDHLEEKHNMFLSQQSILYDYTFVSEQGIELKLNWLQNLEINVRKGMGFDVFQIGGTAGKVLTVNLKEMLSQHPTLGKCKIISFKTKTLKRNKQYLIWTVDIADKPQDYDLFGHQLHQPISYFSKSESQRYVFYSEQLQQAIQKNYQEFQKNERLNEFCMDVRETRFRISFEDMTQTNTYTKSKKPILRVPFVLK